MKKIFTLLMFLAVGIVAQAQLLMYEDFNYSTGNLVPSNGSWTNHSGTQGQVQITSGGLSYTSYPTNSSSNKIAINGTNGEDISKTITTQSTVGTKVYCSFLVNVSATNGTGTYFAHFQNGTSNFTGRLWAKTIGAGVDFGLAAAGTATFLGTEYALNTTHLIVMSYEIVSGSANDIVKLWVNPDLSGVEPASLLSITSGTDLASIQSFGFRQATGTPTCSIDEVKVGLSWSIAPLPISLVKFTADKVAEKVKIQWTTATEVNNDKFVIERSHDGKEYEFVSEVSGAGNSKELNSYEITDASPLKGTSYYRLTQFDFDGQSETFAPVAVSMDAKNIEIVKASSTSNAINLNIFSPMAMETSILVRDLSGRTVASEKISLTEGYQNIQLNTSNYSSGIHLIQLVNGEQAVVKKLVL